MTGTVEQLTTDERAGTHATGPVTAEAETAGAGASQPGVAARKRAAVELIRSHETVLRGTARRYSICGDDADDAYQRGLEILLEKAPSTDPRQLVPWARTVIKHEALAVRRTRERTLVRPGAGEVREEETDWTQLIPSEQQGPEDRVAAGERVARSREALAQLKPHELKALTQLAEGYSYAEIGALNRWTRTKVNRCLAEGRARFRSAFRESELGERCARIEPLLSACADGELDPARLAEVRDHLAVCGSCRSTLRMYRVAPRVAVALAPLLPVSRSLWGRLHELALGVHGKFQSFGFDPAGVSAGSTAGARGTLPLAATKIAALCAGTAGTAAVCVATGVLPAPVVAPHPGRAAEPRVVQPGNGRELEPEIRRPEHALARRGHDRSARRRKSRDPALDSQAPPLPRVPPVERREESAAVASDDHRARVLALGEGDQTAEGPFLQRHRQEKAPGGAAVQTPPETFSARRREGRRVARPRQTQDRVRPPRRESQRLDLRKRQSARRPDRRPPVVGEPDAVPVRSDHDPRGIRRAPRDGLNARAAAAARKPGARLRLGT